MDGLDVLRLIDLYLEFAHVKESSESLDLRTNTLLSKYDLKDPDVDADEKWAMSMAYELITSGMV